MDPTQQPSPAAAAATTTSTPQTTTTASPKDTFQWPREYSFPPFFTMQPNLTTRNAQLKKWSALVRSYCAHHRIFKLHLPSSSSSSSGDADSADELWANRRLNRRLAAEDARIVVDFMRREGAAEWVDGDGGGAAGTGAAATATVAWIYWRTLEEWALVVQDWVEATAQKGGVLTLYEITDGEGTRGTELHGLDRELLQKALGTLVKRGKAQIFGSEDSLGVKFF